MEGKPHSTTKLPKIRLQTNLPPLMPTPSQQGVQEWDEVDTEMQNGGLLLQRDEWSPSWKPIASVYNAPRHILSFIGSVFRFSGGPRTMAKMRPTAYLDGLRGFACLIVYFHHHQLFAHWKKGQAELFERGFGYGGNYYAIAFPFIRNFFSGGHFAVSIFFVMSGYVLSLKLLHLIQAGDHIQLGDHVASSLFRRWLRLFIPLFVTLAVYASLLHSFGGITPGDKLLVKQGSWKDEMWNLYCKFKNFSYIFGDGGEPFFTYNSHLWSIPVEMKGSILVYTSLMAFSRCTRNARLWGYVALFVYFMYICDGSYYTFFCAGMLLCDLDLLAEKDELPDWMVRLTPYRKWIFYHLFIASLYLGGVPSFNAEINDLRESRGWYLLSLLKPQAVFDPKWFYLFWASLFFVSSIPHLPWLKRFFETSFCQYLGRISFSLYLVHGPILAVVGERLYMLTGWVGDEPEDIMWWADRFPLPGGPLGFELSFLAPHLILLPLTLFVADLVTRGIDTPSVRFAAWLYKQTLGDASNGGNKTKA
ncbi:unnamed protein product [Clonostachys rosea f. rosea IK726]|jgi:peptidoglycan/LPS O-acetylase OafA/YrhL|uniref:Acyltransferase 3 domain-containing protein n=2 Tax=Bionectria ochroleuca TaxID=29856 RepID=A0A0B7KIU7_BIOOC|nr:unnamed protein product [Clonostachys rosea f. rosea IK726]